MRRRCIAVIATSLLLAAVSPPALADRDDQWLFRSKLGSGEPEPTAIFLSWDYRAVIFRATCDARTHELVLEYYDDEVTLGASDRIAITGGSKVPLATRLIDRHLEGRVAAGPDLVSALSDDKELLIDAPNAMQEPWYVGSAEPLKRVAEICAQHG